MTEEGLFHWYEHTGDAASPSLGSHTLVIADHNGAFVSNAQPAIRYTQPGAVMQKDSSSRWRSERRWQANAIELHRWDYRSLGQRPVSATGGLRDAADATALVVRAPPRPVRLGNQRPGPESGRQPHASDRHHHQAPHRRPGTQNRQINSPNIHGPFDTKWGSTNFDAQLRDANWPRVSSMTHWLQPTGFQTQVTALSIREPKALLVDSAE